MHPCRVKGEGEGSETERESRTYPGLIVAFTSAVQPEKRIERKRGGRGKNPRFPGSRLDSFGFAVMRKRSEEFAFTRHLTQPQIHKSLSFFSLSSFYIFFFFFLPGSILTSPRSRCRSFRPGVLLIVSRSRVRCTYVVEPEIPRTTKRII